MDDWAPQMSQDEWGTTDAPITEEFDPTWKYNFKWGVDGRTGQAHIWRVKSSSRGAGPYHRAELTQLLGRDPQVRQGDLLGLASYIPAEVKLDGTLVAPPTILVQTYYGMNTPPSVFEEFERMFPGAVARNSAIVKSSSIEIPFEWQQKVTPEAIQSLRTELSKEHPEEEILLESDPALKHDFSTPPAYNEIIHQKAAQWAQETFSAPLIEGDKGFIESWVAGLRKALRRSGAIGADKDGAMVALYIPKEIGKKIRIRGGEPLEDLHITLAYFEDKAADRDDWDNASKIVEQFSRQHGGFKGVIGGYGVFNTPDGDVLWASPDIPGINELRHELVEALDEAGFTVSKEHGFTPHITLKYEHSGKLPKLDKPIDISFDVLTFTEGGKKKEHQFSGDGFTKIISEL